MNLSKRQLQIGVGVLLMITVVMYLFITDKFSLKTRPTETQIGSGKTSIDPVTGKIQQKTMSLDDYLTEIKEQLDSGFTDNYAKITKTEIVSLNDDSGKSVLKDNFYLVRFDIGATDDTEKIGEFFQLMIEQRNQGGSSINVEEAMVKFKESKNYDVIVGQIKTNLDSVYGDIMSKGFYMIVEDRNGIYIVNRVGDYLNENYRSALRIEDQNGLLVFRLLVDFFNYGRLYKANDSEVQTVLGVSNLTLKRNNVLETLVGNSGNNTSFSDFQIFLNKIKDKF